MWLGKPVILTAYSGTEDYATDETAFRIPFHLVPVEAGAYPGVEEGEAGGYYWAEPYVLEAAARLRLLLARPDFAAALGERGAMRVRTLYHPLRVGRAILEALGLGEASGRPAEVSAPPRRRRIKLASGAS
jgi:glycosyltransferase involved in cell wall biosynthesis